MWPPSGRIQKARTAAVFAVLGIGTGLVLHCSASDEEAVRASRQAATQILDAEHARAAAMTAVGSAKLEMQRAEREAKTASARAAEARDRVRVVSADDVIVSAGPNAVPEVVRVPAPVIDRLRLDSVALTAFGTLVRWKDTVIVRQDQRISADSIELAATRHAFTALQRTKESRCGRKCGIVLGVGGLLAAAVTIGQVRRTFR